MAVDCSGLGGNTFTVGGHEAGNSDASVNLNHADNPMSIVSHDAGKITDAGPQPDAFFINDPAPPVCGPDGGMSDPKPVGGTPECPDDKNRQGCPCKTPGETAACWPGKRLNRGKGDCKDGMTKCERTPEFGSVWGACMGYVLPAEGGTQGPEACACFSNGVWTLNNLVPCVYDTGTQMFLYSSHPDTNNGYACNPVSMSPPSKPPEAWSSSTLTGDCAGQFKLCYTMKAGLVGSPKPEDCVVMQNCINVWYSKPGEALPLPNLPGWTSTDTACSKKFIDQGGYGEMTVVGKSIDCDAVDDGRGHPYVFKRTSYCLPSCVATPNKPECKGCSTGGSGQF
jgi:hypothetical protein